MKAALVVQLAGLRFQVREQTMDSGRGWCQPPFPETDIGATKGHETDGCEGTMLRFILFRGFVAFNIGFGALRRA